MNVTLFHYFPFLLEKTRLPAYCLKPTPHDYTVVKSVFCPSLPTPLQHPKTFFRLHQARWDGICWGGGATHWDDWADRRRTQIQLQPKRSPTVLTSSASRRIKIKSLNLNISLAHAWECLPVPWQFHEVVHGRQKKAQVGILHCLLRPNIKVLAWQPPGLLKEDSAA